MLQSTRQRTGVASVKGSASIFALTLAGSIALTGSPARAQVSPAPPAATDSLEEIIVTAQFREQSLQTTPLAITAINSDMLRQQGFTDISDLSAVAPNVTLEKGSGLNTGASQFFIRGVGQYDILPALDQGVGVYIDDVYFGSTFGANLDLIDLDRVEILRGPQGTLAGFNSIGGAVKLYSQKPTGSGGGYLEAGYGSNDKLDLRGAYDIAIIPDQLFLRVSGASISDNGYINRIDYACAYPALAGTLPEQNPAEKGCVLGREGGSDDNTLRVALRWLPMDGLEENFSADLESDTMQPSANTLIAINNAVIPAGWQALQQSLFGITLDSRFIPPRGQYVSYDGYTDPVLHYTLDPNGFIHAYGLNNTLDYKLADNLSLKLISGYRRTDGYQASDVSAAPLMASGGTYAFAYHQFTQEVRLNGTALDRFLDYTVGAFYFDSYDIFDQFVDGPEGLFFLPGGLVKTGHDLVTEKSTAGYGTVTLHPTSQLSLIGGYRYTHTYKTYDFNDYGVFSPLLDVVGQGPAAISDHSDYRGSIQYQWTPELMTYLQYSTGFKAGGINPTPTTIAQALPFGPETLQSYEVGLKSEFLDHHLRVNLAGFTSKYVGYQMDAFQADGASIYTNAGNARISGAELEVNAQAGGFMANASASYLHWRWLYIDDSPVPGVPDLQGPCSSCTNLYTPSLKGDLGFQYTIPLGGYGGLTPRLEGNYVSRMYSDPQNTFVASIPPRGLANFRLTWQSAKADWQVALAITNLFDKFYYENTNAAEYVETGFAAAEIGRPREAMVTLRRNF